MFLVVFKVVCIACVQELLKSSQVRVNSSLSDNFLVQIEVQQGLALRIKSYFIYDSAAGSID